MIDERSGEEIRLVVNGKSKDVPASLTVGEFIATLGLDAARTLVELNGEPLERRNFGDTKLVAGARIEIAQMVGGG
ncbi:MAG TPA: sulfur carrier protein ThiS [Candidatus Eremiobacteraceae bacterium]|nr:sulfur carrier protein ThiS [Candidatus Eremiobacteraceae bacterium]